LPSMQRLAYDGSMTFDHLVIFRFAHGLGLFRAVAVGSVVSRDTGGKLPDGCAVGISDGPSEGGTDAEKG
jgi:hypothetical protein